MFHILFSLLVCWLFVPIPNRHNLPIPNQTIPATPQAPKLEKMQRLGKKLRVRSRLASSMEKKMLFVSC